MILSVAGGKGGTGKTTIAVNPALSLERIHSQRLLKRGPPIGASAPKYVLTAPKKIRYQKT
jgi:Mrp family chromosome partitioning ATPase